MKFRGLLVGFVFAIASMNAAAVTVIDFGTGNSGTGGTIGYNSNGVDVSGSDILIGSLTVEDAPGAGTYVVDALLSFDTEANTILIRGTINALGISAVTDLLSGSFNSFNYDDTQPTDIFSGAGPDIKHADLLTALGIPVNTPFEFFGFSLQSVNGSVISTDIVNTAVVPVPAAVWLFGSGLLGMIAVARRRRI